MKRFKMQKLVRDKIIDFIETRGGKAEKKILNENEFFNELKLKLKEEVAEFEEVQINDRDNFLNELGDIQLLVDYLLKSAKISKEELNEAQSKKMIKSGGFDKRIFMETVDLQDDDEWVENYRKKGFEEIKVGQ